MRLGVELTQQPELCHPDTHESLSIVTPLATNLGNLCSNSHTPKTARMTLINCAGSLLEELLCGIYLNMLKDESVKGWHAKHNVFMHYLNKS